MSDAPSPLQPEAGELTVLLQRAEAGEVSAAEKILPLVYGELRKLAASKMARETPGHTLQPTALVHEAWLRLGGEAQPSWKSPRSFLRRRRKRCSGFSSTAPGGGRRNATVAEWKK